MNKSKGPIDVIVEDLIDHPHCSHGPTILFSRLVKGEKKRFFACSAYRERKHCNFFLWEHEKIKLSNIKKDFWDQERKKLLNDINHENRLKTLNRVCGLPIEKRIYCNTCALFVLSENEGEHMNHNLLKGITDHGINHPSETLPSLENAKREAQYLFSKVTLEALVNILKDLQYKYVICIGTPTLHEFIRNNCKQINSILLDIDNRYHNFFGPLEYCWYNMFNHHFFFTEAEKVFQNFLKSRIFFSNGNLVLVTDPPFGGRVEPLAFTFNKISEEYKIIFKGKDLPIFWIFPYFMEPQILNSLPDFKMLDYKVVYENHASFGDGFKGRKQGSPVRIFTNVNPGLIKLPESDYRFCKPCNRWVSKENAHCYQCNACPSKDGRTYVHCATCKRCVKPTWKHCDICSRCAQVDHKCGILEFSKDCFHCKKQGHKKSECPQLLISYQELGKKRRKTKTSKLQKKKKS